MFCQVFGTGFRIFTIFGSEGTVGLGFQVLSALKMPMLILWVVTPCGLTGRPQHVGSDHCKESFILMVMLVNSTLTRSEYVLFINLHNTTTADSCSSESVL